MHEELTLRMLGENVKLTRVQWEQLRDMLDPQSVYDKQDAANTAHRITEMLARAGLNAKVGR
jgi:Spy/CpxP family protein refolding chaperone